MIDNTIFWVGHALPILDIASIEDHPNLIQEGEEVVITEKLHGNFIGITIIVGVDYWPHGFSSHTGKSNILIWNKAIGRKAFSFKDCTGNVYNTHVTLGQKIINTDGFKEWYDIINGIKSNDVEYYHIIGEIIGEGIQDLSYGLDEPEFKLIAMIREDGDDLQYACHDAIIQYAKDFEVQPAPIMYMGPYSDSVLDMFKTGQTAMNADHNHEGIVIQTKYGRSDAEFGEVILKYISEDFKQKGA